MVGVPVSLEGRSLSDTSNALDGAIVRVVAVARPEVDPWPLGFMGVLYLADGGRLLLRVAGFPKSALDEGSEAQLDPDDYIFIDTGSRFGSGNDESGWRKDWPPGYPPPWEYEPIAAAYFPTMLKAVIWLTIAAQHADDFRSDQARWMLPGILDSALNDAYFDSPSNRRALVDVLALGIAAIKLRVARLAERRSEGDGAWPVRSR
jgi:hypothetical protein